MSTIKKFLENISASESRKAARDVLYTMFKKNDSNLLSFEEDFGLLTQLCKTPTQAMGLLARKLFLERPEQPVEHNSDPIPSEEGPADIEGDNLSNILIRYQLADDAREEPKPIIDYLKSKFEEGKSKEIVKLIENNMNSVVLIGFKQMLTEGLDLQTDRLDSMPIWIDEKGAARIYKGFPFADQKSVMAKLPVPGTTLPVFLGTGFITFWKQEVNPVVMTARHVVDQIRDAIREHPNLKKDLCVVQGFYYEGKKKISKPRIIFEIDEGETFTKPDQNIDNDTEYFKIKIPEGVELSAAIISESRPACGREVYCLGHGYGLPLKMAWNGLVTMEKGFSGRCKLESFAGDSGAPIIDAENHRVVGVLSGSWGDYNLIWGGENGRPRRFWPKVYLNGSNGVRFTPIFSPPQP